MDRDSILEQRPPRPEPAVAPPRAFRSSQASVQGSVSAAIAEANTQLGPNPAAPFRFPGDDGGQSLAEMAHRDLDAALQLLAERAQYITGASGAAIALRHGEQHDMLCRASVGSNAPELGALLSTEFGLSGESVRTRLPLRCDDAERDPRVNREGCRELGIASVAVMPVISDGTVLGVFELFSGQANAFDERDLLALQRLSEMVETAVTLANAAGRLPAEVAADSPVPADVEPKIAAAQVEAEVSAPQIAASAVPPEPATETPDKEATPKKPLFWSAALQSNALQENSAAPALDADRSHIPPMLRNLQKCQACGFPVSVGRELCVECEEKKWRGQLKSPAARAPQPLATAAHATSTEAPVTADPTAAAAVVEKTDASPSAPSSAPLRVIAPPNEGAPAPVTVPDSPILAAEPALPSTESDSTEIVAPQFSATGSQASSDTPMFGASLAPTPSWLSANKYILGAILIVAAIIAAIALLR